MRCRAFFVSRRRLRFTRNGLHNTAWGRRTAMHPHLGCIAIPCDSTRNGFHNTAWGRRTAAHPRRLTEFDTNPNGGSTMPCTMRVVWNPVGSATFCGVRPGFARCHGDPRLCCATPGVVASLTTLRSIAGPAFNPVRVSIAIGAPHHNDATPLGRQSRSDAIQPGTGFTTQPGVAAPRRTPGR